MKRLLLTFLLGGMAYLLGAQNYNVSTSEQSKHVLLEEFTGVYCGYCPEGHQIGAHLKSILGERISIVAIHCGPFAPANNDDMDFTVPAGEAIGDRLGATSSGYPNGAVNRKGWNSATKIVYGRGYWEDFARRVIEEKAPVNLWAKAVWNAETQKLSVRVEGYYTEDLSAQRLRLNLMLTQSNVRGYQSGGNMGATYPHQHMLREVFNGVDGDALPKGKQGEFFVKEYTFQIPEYYKKVRVDPAEMELVVFVSQGNKEVLNTISVHPEYEGGTLPLKVALRETKVKVTDRYGYDFFPMEVTSKCNTMITSAEFEVTLNGDTSVVEWTGEIPPFVTREIRIPVDWNQTAVARNKYKVKLKSLNEENYKGDALSGDFKSPTVLPQKLNLTIHTDEFAAENTYRLCDEHGTVLKTFGPFVNGQFHNYEEKLDLEAGRIYAIEVLDAWGNGAYPHGNALELANEEGLVMMSLSVIKNFGHRLFFKTDVPSGIEALSAADTYDVYGLTGKLLRKAARLNELPKGIYIIRSGQEVHKICIR